MGAALELETPSRPSTLPDNADAERPSAAGRIDRVGMEGIELPVLVRVEMGTTVVYSSTCPYSAALSREFAQQRFLERFPAGRAVDRAAVADWIASPDGMPATPHSQRGHAHVRVAMSRSLEGFAHDAVASLVKGVRGGFVD